jgi:predicted GIY-YIG superfamily endonuclease
MPGAPQENVKGTIYLLHFSEPLKHARHYLGWTDDLPTRLRRHARGRGSKLMAAVVAAGITFEVVRTWTEVTRHDERRLKMNSHVPRKCPVCNERIKNSKK